MPVNLLSPEVEVTRSLYNLIKSGVVAINSKEKRVIDSDAVFDPGFRPLVFEKVDEIEAIEDSGTDLDGVFSAVEEEGGLTPEQQDLLFHADSDEAAVKMLVNQKDKGSRKASPKKKEKPAEVSKDAQKLVQEAKEEAETILADARQQAEEILADAREEAGRLTENAHEIGFSEGYQEGNAKSQEELQAAMQELDLKAKQLEQDYAQQIADLEPQVVGLLSELVQKMTGVVLADRNDIVTHLVSECLKGIERSSIYLIHVSSADYHDVLNQREFLEQKVPSASEIRIIEDASLTKGQCLVESDTAIYDSSLDLQLQRLCEDLRILSLNNIE